MMHDGMNSSEWVDRLDQALILFDLALCLPCTSAFSLFVVL